MKIMVCYEGSKGCERLLQAAIQQARAFGAKVDLATSFIVSTLDEERLREKAQIRLGQAKAILEKEGITCETHVMVGGQSEGEDLISFANKNEIDEIIIGSKDRSKLAKLLLGSATTYVILAAKCPVLTVKVDRS
jgi:nucleotide-binding universal stress UspA family protein